MLEAAAVDRAAVPLAAPLPLRVLLLVPVVLAAVVAAIAPVRFRIGPHPPHLAPAAAIQADALAVARLKTDLHRLRRLTIPLQLFTIPLEQFMPRPERLTIPLQQFTFRLL